MKKLLLLSGLWLLFFLSTTAVSQADNQNTYPRLSLGTYWAQDWVAKQGYGLNFLYQFEEIYGVTTSEKVLEIKARAFADGHKDWVKNTIWIQNTCAQTANEYTSQPAGWEYALARNNIDGAINIAVYENQRLGCDWFLYDTHDRKIPVWGDSAMALNVTPACPRGLWDGVIVINGQQFSIGDTRGLTYTEWFTGPFKNAVIKSSLFRQAFNGIQFEDQPSSWFLYNDGRIPDPLRNHIGFPRWQDYEEFARPEWAKWYTDFMIPLQNEFIIRLNGHMLRWYIEGTENPWPLAQESFTACKLEQYGGWGGWPNWDLPNWIKVYIGVEEVYHPLSRDPEDSQLDAVQGWDVSTIQCNPSFVWKVEKVKNWARVGLASTLMGEGRFNLAWKDDYYFTRFLRGGHTEYAPISIPEIGVRLGSALGNYEVYELIPNHPIYYRKFYNSDTRTRYTVVLNVWAQAIEGIPAKDAVWFTGDWPYGRYRKVFK